MLLPETGASEGPRELRQRVATHSRPLLVAAPCPSQAGGTSLRDRAEQVLEDIERRHLDYLQRDFGLVQAQADAYGSWLASLPPAPRVWTHFVTLTHDPRRLGAGHTIVGRQRHRRVLSRWLFDDVRRMDPGALWYSEMELHQSGQSHEHGLLSVSRDVAPVLSMRQAWFDRAGYCDVRDITGGDDAEQVARAIYVAKYTGKATAVEPFIVGFGLHRDSSHSLTFGGAMR